MLRTACSGGKNNLTMYSSVVPNTGVSYMILFKEYYVVCLKSKACLGFLPGRVGYRVRNFPWDRI